MCIVIRGATLLICVMMFARSSNSAEAPKNTEVWRKAIGEGRSIVVERAYVYDEEGPTSVPHFQFTFVLEQKEPEFSRSLLWLRTSWETALSSSNPQPEVDVLDAIVTNGDLLVLFNQYKRCWAYRVSRHRLPAWITSPHEDRAAVRVGGDGAGMVGERMHEGSISIDSEGKVLVDCRDEQRTAHRFRLVGADGTWSWRAEAPPASSTTKATE